MKQFLLMVVIASLTVILFLGMRKLYIRYPNTFLNPVLTSTAIIVLFLIVFNVSYDNYMLGGKWIDALVGPCVVALAYPLYNQRDVLLKYRNAILLGISTGLITAMGSVILFAKLFRFEDVIIYSLLPKSITIPVAIQISAALDGIPSLTAAFVMIAGFSGIIVGPIVLNYMGIHSPLGKGLALGSASHGLGVAKSTEYGELAISMASVSMSLSAIAGSIVGPILVWLL